MKERDICKGEVEIRLRTGHLLIVKEDADTIHQGFIIDLFNPNGTELLDTSTYWYDDL